MNGSQYILSKNWLSGRPPTLMGCTFFMPGAGRVQLPEPISRICLTPLQVDENAPAGTVVALVNAFDEDRNPKQTLTYTLLNDDGGRFQIVGKQLLKRLPANYEAKKAHTITVRVSDNGTPQQFVRKSTFHLLKSAIIVVTLLNISDWSWKFTMTFSHFLSFHV